MSTKLSVLKEEKSDMSVSFHAEKVYTKGAISVKKINLQFFEGTVIYRPKLQRIVRK